MEAEKHSGIGIASFVVSLVSGALMFLLIVIAGFMEASSPGQADPVAETVIGLFLFAFLAAALVALGLGIAGLIQKGRKKLYALLGTIFSSVTIVATIMVVIIGLTMA